MTMRMFKLKSACFAFAPSARRTPFYIRFRSDNYEFAMVEGKAGDDVGAQLSYFMDAQNCN